MKGLFKVKKLSAVFITVLLLMFSTVCFASAYDYSVAEVKFDIPDEFSVLYDEENMPESEAFRFVAEDNSVELSCYCIENSDEISFFFIDLTDAVEYFFDNISVFDSSDFTFESVQTFHFYHSGSGIMFEGTVDVSENAVPIETYVFSTESNIYGFQFLIYNGSGRSYVNEIIDSLYIKSTVYDTEENSTVEPNFLTISYVVILVFLILSFVLKWFSNNKDKTEVSDSKKAIPVKRKTELNGKNMNKYLAKRSGLDNDDNFAVSELERERKEREKMFE